MSNVEFRNSSLDIRHFDFRPCGPDTRHENRDQLVTLFSNGDSLLWAEVHPLDDLQPRLSLAQFLETDLQLVDEILT